MLNLNEILTYKEEIMNILLVDDSKVIRIVLKEFVNSFFEEINDNDFTLFEAADGLEALEYMKKEKIDILFLDWNMPNMNGDQVVNKIRENKEWNKTRIVMATAEGSKEKILKISNKNLSAYLMKPIGKEAMHKVLKKITDRMPKV